MCVRYLRPILVNLCRAVTIGIALTQRMKQLQVFVGKRSDKDYRRMEAQVNGIGLLL